MQIKKVQRGNTDLWDKKQHGPQMKGSSSHTEHKNSTWLVGMSCKNSEVKQEELLAQPRAAQMWHLAFAQHPTPSGRSFGGVSVGKVYCDYTAVKNVSFLVNSVSAKLVKFFFFFPLPWLFLF